MKVAAAEVWPIEKLKLRETNPRRHSLEQIEQIAASMKEFGWTMPVLIDETGMILAGHGRVRAGRLMGFETAPVVIAKGWTEAQKKTYVIADNQLAANSDWDQKLLRSELRSIGSLGADLRLTGISDSDMTKLMIDAPKPESHGEPKEATMVQCPTCLRWSKKKE